jgi:NAD(P)-dependent dehydrogenase (short-subunit alcohol dehydrogenase family)
MTTPNEPGLPGAATSGHGALAGKSAVVTGATEGIGFYAARLLASRGATVLISGRDRQRGSDAVAAIRQAARHDRVEFVSVDHSTVEANEKLAATLMARFDHLDVLVNNVGGIFAKRLVAADGFEMSLALNFLAPFVLTEALLSLLTRGPGVARCVNVVSSSFKMTKGDPFDDIQAERDYVGIFVHGRAKLFTLLWSMGLSHRVPVSRLAVTAVNPGMAWTSRRRLSCSARPAPPASASSLVHWRRATESSPRPDTPEPRGSTGPTSKWYPLTWSTPMPISIR